MTALLLVALLGCGQEREPAVGDRAAVFPHPDGYAGEAHSTDAIQPDPGCESCHSIDGLTASSGPACTSCHPDYPHNADMRSGDVHGGLWAEASQRCAACHGEAGNRAPAGLPPGSCTGCHSTYPHGETWSSPAQHGAAVVHHGGTIACASCHGSDFDDIESGRCHACHPAYPHLAPQWDTPGGHGAAYLSGTSCGMVCHGTDDPLWTPRCDTCHDVYPHGESWTTGHLAVVQARGEQPCQRCHPSGSIQGPTLPVSCSDSCHGGTP